MADCYIPVGLFLRPISPSLPPSLRLLSGAAAAARNFPARRKTLLIFTLMPLCCFCNLLKSLHSPLLRLLPLLPVAVSSLLPICLLRSHPRQRNKPAKEKNRRARQRRLKECHKNRGRCRDNLGFYSAALKFEIKKKKTKRWKCWGCL